MVTTRGVVGFWLVSRNLRPRHAILLCKGVLVVLLSFGPTESRHWVPVISRPPCRSLCNSGTCNQPVVRALVNSALVGMPSISKDSQQATMPGFVFHKFHPLDNDLHTPANSRCVNDPLQSSHSCGLHYLVHPLRASL